MEALSKSYPSALFHYVTDIEGEYRSPSTWFCNGDEGNKKDAENSRKQAYKAEVERFMSATANAADGIEHRVEIMPDGRVAADGENKFGECNIFAWANIKQISCGNWHTVGLKKDGTLVACGSNANGQCDVSDIPGRAVAVSCGRYHTAILLDNGHVWLFEFRIGFHQKIFLLEANNTLSYSSFDILFYRKTIVRLQFRKNYSAINILYYQTILLFYYRFLSLPYQMHYF